LTATIITRDHGARFSTGADIEQELWCYDETAEALLSRCEQAARPSPATPLVTPLNDRINQSNPVLPLEKDPAQRGGPSSASTVLARVLAGHTPISSRSRLS
jgi:hypothetical protein